MAHRCGQTTESTTLWWPEDVRADPTTGLVSAVSPLQDLGKVNKFFADNLLSPVFTLASSPLNIPTQISNQVPPETAIQNNITKPIATLEGFPAGLADLLRDIAGGTSGFAAADVTPLTTDPTPGPRKLTNPSITDVPGIITNATTNAGLGKTDPTLGSKSSITDVPGSLTAPQRKSASRLVNLGLNSTDRTDTGGGGRHRLENIGHLASSWTPSTRKLNGQKDSTTPGHTADATSGSNPSDNDEK